MSYKEFDINAAINPVVSRESVKLAGVSEVAKIYNSKSLSTEEFISGAIHDLGVSNRNVMFVNSSLSGLRDRLAIAAKVAKNVNTAKDRGVEGFGSVSKMDPWEFALESGIGDFFKKIWQAIVSACTRLIQAIANIIKHIRNFIVGLDAKQQSKDYKYYMDNRQLIENNAKKFGSGKTKFNAANWKVDGTKISEAMKKVTSLYTKIFTKGGDDEKVFENLASYNLNQVTDPKQFKAMCHKVFGGLLTFTAEGEGNHLRKYLEGTISKIDGSVAEVKKVLGAPNDATSASKIVSAFAVKGDTVQITAEEMKKKSDNFSILSEKWLAENVKNYVVDLDRAMRQFTKYTSTITKVFKRFEKVGVDGKSDSGKAFIKSLSAACADLAQARIRTNNMATSIIFELELQALRFRKNAHTALKIYMRAKSTKPAPAKKTSAESLFLF